MIFDFANESVYKKVLQETWEEFRNCLANKDFTYSDIQSALNTRFLRVFDDLFEHGYPFFEKSIYSVLNSGVNLVRAARINSNDPLPNYDRFIPDAKYITKANRFSPPGVEWLYLAFSDHNENGDLCLEEKCALRECRAKVGDTFALCHFLPSDTYEDKKIIDLTIAKEVNFETINNELEEHGKEVFQREFKKMYNDLITTGITTKPNLSDMIISIEKWAVYTYALLLSEQIFLPLTTEDRDIIYAPFQCMAEYFLQKGYIGIVYSSTVFPDGKNIVLFDKNAAIPYGEIKRITV